MNVLAHQPLARKVGLFGLGIGIAAVARRTLAQRTRRALSPVSLKASITIQREPEEIYRFWRNLGNLPLFMRHIESVTESDGHSSWYAKGPMGTRLEWEAEIVGDRPNERIAWRSLEGAKLSNHGSVEFRRAPRGQGTEVHLELGFDPPLGKLGAKVARLFEQIPELELENDLRRLKQLIEVGEIVRSDASIHHGRHAARPVKSEEMPLVQGMVQS